MAPPSHQTIKFDALAHAGKNCFGATAVILSKPVLMLLLTNRSRFPHKRDERLAWRKPRNRSPKTPRDYSPTSCAIISPAFVADGHFCIAISTQWIAYRDIVTTCLTNCQCEVVMPRS